MFSACPCGSIKPFVKCCKPFITGSDLPKTAEQLMRSRYTAYTRANITYIFATQAGQAAENFNGIEAKQWALSVKWQGLTVLKTEAGSENDNTGIVEFTAYFKQNSKLETLHEISQFQKIDGKWFYTGYCAVNSQS